MNEGEPVHYGAGDVDVSFNGAPIGGLADIRIGLDRAPARSRSRTAVTTVTATVPLTIVGPIVGPIVVIDRERREAMVGERVVYWRAFDRGDGSTLVRVAGVGQFVVGPDRDFDTPEPCFEFGSTRRRRARQVLCPLARAWCQLPQRGPRGRKAGRT